MDRSTPLDEFNKVIVVDFGKKKVNLSIEYQTKYEKLEQLKEHFRESLKIISEVTGDKTYANHKMFEFVDIASFIENKLESMYSKDRDGM